MARRFSLRKYVPGFLAAGSNSDPLLMESLEREFREIRDALERAESLFTNNIAYEPIENPTLHQVVYSAGSNFWEPLAGSGEGYYIYAPVLDASGNATSGEWKKLTLP